MAKAGSYIVIYTPDGSRWSAEIRGHVSGAKVVTWGPSLAVTRRRIREALATALDDQKAAEAAQLREVHNVGKGKRLRSLMLLRQKTDLMLSKLAQETREQARLLSKQGFSVRDISEMVGVSHRRIHQLLDTRSTGRGQEEVRRERLLRHRAFQFWPATAPWLTAPGQLRWRVPAAGA